MAALETRPEAAFERRLPRRHRRTMLFRFVIAAVIALLGASPATAARDSAQDSWSGVEKIVAIGDVHGDYDAFARLLQAAGLIDENHDWAGGTAHLVQTGDVLDRGPDSRKVMDLLMKLEEQSRRQGGYVHALIGNHEAMNMYGDLRYVVPEEYEAFRTPGSESARSQRDQRMPKQARKSSSAREEGRSSPTGRQHSEEDDALGQLEHRRAFEPNGEYGKWIRGHNTVIKINDTLFLHAGISPKYARRAIRRINETVRAALIDPLADLKKLNTGILLDPEGPLWYRGLAREPWSRLKSHVEAVLKKHGVQRLVIGHTLTLGAVRPRFGARVVMIDVGLAAFYGGTEACLILKDGQVYALHRGRLLPIPEEETEVASYLKKVAAVDLAPSTLTPVIRGIESQSAGSR